jgi:hypothetical protein
VSWPVMTPTPLMADREGRWEQHLAVHPVRTEHAGVSLSPGRQVTVKEVPLPGGLAGPFLLPGGI